MSIVNLNDLLPTAYPGMENVLWQYQLYPDGRNRYISACYRPGLGVAMLHTGSYTATNDDASQLLSFLISSDAILTLPSIPPRSNWNLFVENLGSADLHVVSTINVDGSTDAILVPPNQGLTIFTSLAGNSYYTLRGLVAPATSHSIGGITLSGDIGGSAQTASVVGLRGIPLFPASPTDGQLLQYQSGPNAWVPVNFDTYSGPSSGFINSGGIGRVIQETPGGAVDGVNAKFYLTYIPSPQIVILFRDNAGFHPDVQYTLSGNVVTFAVAPQRGALITATYFLGAGTPTAVPTVISQTLSFISAHTESSGSPGGGGVTRTSIGLFTGPPDLLADASTWAKRTDTFSLSSTDVTNIQNGSFYILVGNYHIGGASGGWADVFDVYDSYVTITMSDSTTQTWRASAYTIDTSNGSGGVANPTNAYDGSSTTFAEITTSGYGPFTGGIFISFSNWVRVA